MLRHILLATALVFGAVPVSAQSFSTLSGHAPLVIAHRGASAYLPEHTLGAYELAIRMGADIVEPDVQLTADGALVAMHDTDLTRTTDVASIFAPRNDAYNVSDFTLAEIKTLTVTPTGPASTDHLGFTPGSRDAFKVPTLREVLDFVTAHNAASGDAIGVYPESKTPNRSELSRKIVDALNAAGFTTADQSTYLQSFSHAGAEEMARYQNTLGMDLPVAALGAAVGDKGAFGVRDYTTDRTSSLEALAQFAGGVGVSLDSPSLTEDFIESAHAHGLEVHGWTFRPKSIAEARARFAPYFAMGMDAVFTDYPDLAVQVRTEFAESIR
ncbi:glycerophosphodiester phosphodiesterase family protein [Roseovarius sp. D22-M7]|uniref:glycerophosphodiester phosphodiesterase family protein n=1 Tax=Roseovarius sp. D22-M7 TaxID=3127116 RepID=UPI00301018C2